MTPTKRALLSAPAGPAPRRCRPVLAWWAGLVMAFGAHAAVSVTATTDAQLPSAGATTRSLDKALGGDLSTGDRNLDLLLDTQRRGTDRLDETPAVRAMPERSANGRLAIQPLPEAFRPVQALLPLPEGNRAVAPLAMPGQVLQAPPSSTVARATRDWRVGVAQGTGGSSDAAAGSYSETTGVRPVDLQLRAWVFAGLAFVKEHLVAIVLAGAAIAVLAMGLKAYSRRI